MIEPCWPFVNITESLPCQGLLALWGDAAAAAWVKHCFYLDHSGECGKRVLSDGISFGTSTNLSNLFNGYDVAPCRAKMCQITAKDAWIYQARKPNVNAAFVLSLGHTSCKSFTSILRGSEGKKSAAHVVISIKRPQVLLPVVRVPGSWQRGWVQKWNIKRAAFTKSVQPWGFSAFSSCVAGHGSEMQTTRLRCERPCCKCWQKLLDHLDRRKTYLLRSISAYRSSRARDLSHLLLEWFVDMSDMCWWVAALAKFAAKQLHPEASSLADLDCLLLASAFNTDEWRMSER